MRIKQKLQKFIFLGDVHGDLNYCNRISKLNPTATIIQIGDFGVGFVSNELINNKIPKNFKFFPGNHDNRQLCRDLPCYLGDYGDYFGKFFFVSGADSIDREWRIENISWWADEQLNMQQAEDCLEKWKNSPANVLVAHDAPQSFVESLFLVYDRTLTRNLLQAMIEARKPELFICGHWHCTRNTIIDGITVKILNINENIEVFI